jgi:IclR family transcriptional regulator, pca regulon regulatory protein
VWRVFGYSGKIPVRMTNGNSHKEHAMLESAPEPVNAAAEAGDAAPRPGDTYVQSFARGLAVLRSFGASAPAQTLSEAAERAGLTRAGARRILLTLQQLGYVDCDGRLFRLTPKVLELGFAYLSSLPLWHLAQPPMEELVREIGESCSAAVLEGNDIVYVLRVPAGKIMAINLGVGSRLPAHCTSMGRVLLAGLDDVTLRHRLATLPITAHTSRTLTDRTAVFDEIRKVRAQGHALVDSELEEGLVSMAAPIVNRSGQVVAAINISGQIARTPVAQMQAEFLPRLLATAQRINALLRAQN